MMISRVRPFTATSLPQNSNGALRFSGPSNDQPLTVIEPVSPRVAEQSVLDGAAKLLQLLIPTSIAAGSAYYVNNSLIRNMSHMTSKMGALKDSIIQELKPEPVSSFAKYGWGTLKVIGGACVAGVIAFFAGNQGVESAFALDHHDRNPIIANIATAVANA